MSDEGNRSELRIPSLRRTSSVAKTVCNGQGMERLPRAKKTQGAPRTSERPRTGRARARYWYETPDACTQCQAPGKVERHHIDGNPTNNDQANIAFLCRRCHMEEDGRIGGALRREVCRNGHLRTPENTYVSPSGQRTCRICKTARKQGK